MHRRHPPALPQPNQVHSVVRVVDADVELGQVIVYSVVLHRQARTCHARPRDRLKRRLAAEAAGVRATGIGCFFDDPVQRVMGFNDASFQSLYHFTTGGPVEDPRLTTLPPYALDH